MAVVASNQTRNKTVSTTIKKIESALKINKTERVANAVKMFVLTKCVKSDEVNKHRDLIKAGTYPVNMKVHIKGILNVEKPETNVTPTTDIPLIATIALFVKYAGVTGPHAMEALRKAVTDALELGEHASTTIQNMTEIEQEIKTVKQQVLSKLPKTKKRGKTNFCVDKLEITELKK